MSLPKFFLKIVQTLLQSTITEWSLLSIGRLHDDVILRLLFLNAQRD